MRNPILAVVAGVLAAASASATTYNYQDINDYRVAGVNGTGPLLNSTTTSFSDSWTINPTWTADGKPTITEATATFVFREGPSDKETITVNMGDSLDLFTTGGPFAGKLDLIVGLDTEFIVDLSADGILHFKVIRNSGTFTLETATLDVTAVPDGGQSLLLLGMGLLGVVGFQHKIRNSR